MAHTLIINPELVASGSLDEHGKMQPKIQPAQSPRRIIFCRDCCHYIATVPIPRPHGVPREAPGGCRQGRTTPDSWPPIYPFTGWCCAGWAATDITKSLPAIAEAKW